MDQVIQIIMSLFERNVQDLGMMLWIAADATNQSAKKTVKVGKRQIARSR